MWVSWEVWTEENNFEERVQITAREIYLNSECNYREKENTYTHTHEHTLTCRNTVFISTKITG